MSQRTYPITVRVTRQQHRSLRQEARKRGLSLSAFLRNERPKRPMKASK